MSRTIRGSKPQGHEFWSRRPSSLSSGKIGKKATKSSERMLDKELIRNELKEVELTTEEKESNLYG